jgi:hypothetical protein
MNEITTKITTPVVITLVHGTFSRNAAWCKEGSIFRTNLQAQLGPMATIEVCNWSGWNFNVSRLRGANVLGDQVLQIGRRGHPQILIGHSHGGNVISYALRRSEVASHVKGVITLATPFLNAYPRPFEGWLIFNIYCLAALAMFLCLGTAAYFVFEAGWELKLLHIALPGILTLFFVAVVFYVMYMAIYLLWIVPVKWIVARFTVRLKATQSVALKHVAAPLIDNLPLLVCRTVADEAGLLLSIARLSTEWLFDFMTEKFLTALILFTIVPGNVANAYLQYSHYKRAQRRADSALSRRLLCFLSPDHYPRVDARRRLALYNLPIVSALPHETFRFWSGATT